MAGTILIADDLVTDRMALKARLSAARHRVVQVRSLEGLKQSLAETPPDAILMDMQFPGGGVAGCRMLRRLALARDVPIVLYGAASDAEARLAAFAAGSDECLSDLPGETLLLALLRNLMRKRATIAEMRRREIILGGALAETASEFEPRLTLGLVPIVAADGILWRKDLAVQTRAHIQLMTRAQALERATDYDNAPNAFLLAEDPENPTETLRLISELRARPGSRHAVLIVQSADDLSEIADMALDLGADAVIPGPFAPDEITIRLERLVQRKREVDRLRDKADDHLDEVLRDPLTGLYNRRYVTSYMQQLRQETEEHPKDVTLIMLDIDHFKAVNDQFGHRAGDDVLKGVALRLRAALREADLAARIGGEEFLIVLRDTDRATAELVAERLRVAVGSRPFPVRDGTASLAVTASLGVTVHGGSETFDAAALTDEADRALYASKAAGRNTVTFAVHDKAA